LAELQAKHDLAVEWLPYELRPEPVPLPDMSGPDAERFRANWARGVAPLAEQFGVEMHFPPYKPRSRLAHEAARFAARHGRLEAFHEELFRAFFQHGEDIGRADVLVALGAGVGMDGAALGQALERREFEGEVVADEELAERLGVHAVPAYVAARRRLVTGVRSLAELRELLYGAGGR
jgi:predicted DsbA family dithiol-disulfide isomerase